MYHDANVWLLEKLHRSGADTSGPIRRVLPDPKDSATANPDRTIFPGAGIRYNPGGKGPARDALTWTRHEGLRECFAEYARHPLPTFIKAFNS